METKIFISHTKKDKICCNEFDTIIARVGIDAFLSEYEDIDPPAWKTIKDEINKSVALFLLVGKELYESQQLPFKYKEFPDTEYQNKITSWRHTQNWIAYEIGLACQNNIDVWAICYGMRINFPMPYINNYCITTESLTNETTFKYLKSILDKYKNGGSFPFPHINSVGRDLSMTCPHKSCGANFNFHNTLNSKWRWFKCPQCLRTMTISK